MQTPVYRNLDQPFQIYGFTPPELTILVAFFVGGGEAAQTIGISRLWAFLLTAVLALGIYFLRRTLGNLFGRRLNRFIGLPRSLAPKLFFIERTG